MSRKSAAWLGSVLLCLGPCLAFAATPTPIAQSVQTAATGERLRLVSAEVSLLMNQAAPLLGQSLASARTPEDIAAHIDGHQQAISTLLNDARQVKARLSALPPLGAAYGLQGELADQLTINAISQASDIETMMLALVDIKTAISSADDARLQAELAKLRMFGITSLEANALTSRARAALLPPGQSSALAAVSNAMFLEGTADILRGAYVVKSPSEAAQAIRTKAAEMADVNRAGQAALDAEVRAGPANDADRPLMAQAVPLQREIFVIMGEAETILIDAANDLSEGRSPIRHLQAVNAIQTRLQSAVARLADLMSGQN